ncbi:ribosome maturation factor RimM [Synechococcus sp. BSF8S]|uniref:ribosome maturation factor RimM n=1 Tax=Synechococcales TaxID=1890424 RepID=UPI001628240B|nr:MULTISPECIES: ribosome maturation factor RimM [unclassified Synechococcus]MBC1261216.1 ribosome maturation factor RimM [Synechococcus sp. BSF8S]MBC1264119.1 ribosome maturation factor RimM [Synechococcus sp. BSA11S]MCT0248849.1 ribosome maturation factor RimM [Synechococcus sp. CS-205]
MVNEQDDPEAWLVVGKVVAAQGLQGELRVLPRTDFPERFTRAGRRWLRRSQESPRAVRLLSGRQLPGRELFVVRLEGVGTREEAEALVHHDLLVEAGDRPRLQEGEFHLLDLQGLQVRLAPRGEVIGTVVDLIHAGNDLLEVELSGEPARRALIPFVEAIVPRVDIAGGWLEITPPPGLLDT